MGIADDEKGDTKGFMASALSFINSAYEFSIYMMENDIDAQTLVQKTYIRAYKSFNRAEKGIDFKIWLFTILVNNLKEEAYRFKSSNADPLKGGDFDIGFAELSSEINIALKKIPLKYRIMLLLIDMEEFSYKDTAHIIGCPIEKVRTDISMARKLIGQSLKGYSIGNTIEPVSNKHDLYLIN